MYLLHYIVQATYQDAQFNLKSFVEIKKHLE